MSFISKIRSVHFPIGNRNQLYGGGRSRKRRFTMLAVGMSCSLALAACGSAKSASGKSTKASAAGVTVAESQLKQYGGPSKWVPPGPRFNGAKVRGKSIWYIAGDYSVVPVFSLMYNGMKTALAPLHDSVKLCDGQGVPTGYATCMSEALAAGASAIVTAAIPAATITNELAQAKADHVPVVLGIDKNVTTPAPRNIAAVVSYPYKLIGQLDADWVIANSGGTANVLVINVQGSNPLLMVTQGGSIPQLAKVCPKCNVTVQNVPLANLSEVASITTTALQSNPKISYVIAGMDTVAGIMIPAIKQVGYENKISITGLNGSLQEMLMMAQGTPMKMDVATAGPYLGYAAADQVLRLLAGVAPSRDEAAPVRVFNQSTVHSIKLTQSAFSSDVWFNPNGHFLQKFWALWGVKP